MVLIADAQLQSSTAALTRVNERPSSAQARFQSIFTTAFSTIDVSNSYFLEAGYLH